MEKKISELLVKLAVCHATCNYCFNACLNENEIKMMKECIKLNRDCAEICALAISLVSSYSRFDKDILRLCIKACDRCSGECRKHDYIHCQECARACEECAAACRAYN
ncbi:four-helix bundle copper-binding protein [Paludibacteraceae bacterium OttesenSCG-928-F17]|nr:four-helix bundle copper-binding protein [Paludibacteraceae bacterium OttesenSCG-928-F17]